MLAAVAAVVGIVVAIGVIGNPVDWGDQRWQDFKGDYDKGGFGSSRFSGDLGSGRYDFWRVALDDEFSESPVVGEGADNFAVTYLEHRETSEEPFYPHSLPIRILAGTGIVGALLFAGFAIAAIVAAFRSRIRDPAPVRPRDRRGRAERDGATSPCTAAATGSGPSPRSRCRSSPGWASPAAGSRAARPGRPGGRRLDRRRRTVRIALTAAAVIAAVAAFASLALPWIVGPATSTAPRVAGPVIRPAAAAHLDTARDLNPLTARRGSRRRHDRRAQR